MEGAAVQSNRRNRLGLFWDRPRQMGSFKFEIPSSWQFEKAQASTLHVVGLDGVAWPCRVAREGHDVTVQRNRDESGHVFVAYPFEKYGELVISTGTLPESNAPYRLTVELARGTLNRLRNQLSIWQEGGMTIPSQVEELISQAVGALAGSVFSDNRQEIERSAAACLNLAMDAIYELGHSFSEQVIPVRKGQVNVPKFWLGARMTRWDSQLANLLGQQFEILQFSTPAEIGRPVQNAILGPLLDASPNGMSQRLQEVDDFDARRSVLMADVREKMGCLPDSVKLIHAVSGLNGTGHRLLSYPQQLQATIDVLQTVEDMGNKIPTMVSFDCPWGERLAWSVGGIHPLQIADSLLRRGVCLGMLGLDIHLDYWPTGSLPRDPFQWIDLVDVWSQLGLPIVICLRAPCQVPAKIAEPNNAAGLNTPRTGMDDQARIRLLETVIPMMLARPAVQGIVWQQTTDSDDPRYPASGLVNGHLRKKQTMEMLEGLRRKYW